MGWGNPERGSKGQLHNTASLSPKCNLRPQAWKRGVKEKTWGPSGMLATGPHRQWNAQLSNSFPWGSNGREDITIMLPSKG